MQRCSSPGRSRCTQDSISSTFCFRNRCHPAWLPYSVNSTDARAMKAISFRSRSSRSMYKGRTTMTHKANNRFRIGILLTVLATATSFGGLAQTVQGTISGTVYGPDGKPLAGTTVWANLVSPAPRPVDRSSSIPVLSGVTAGDGSYTLLKEPAGEYIGFCRNTGLAPLRTRYRGGAPLVHRPSGHPDL